ncbi:MAG: DUF4020 domain-containing protein [bacterium]
MWITEHVDIPDEIITAQEEDRLVIFAGAGVSMGAPSNYPDFDDLASQIAGKELTEKDKKQIDVFLGNLKQEGVKVHKRTKEILTNPNSKPNLLHGNIINLFNAPENLRIVTTNFDNHFSTISEESFDEQPDIYYAPALPLGRNFSGIVYLHGCVNKNADDLVVTDSDFGRAYITDGWASRFLIELFQNYTVLFIGYSHNDLVLKYLAKGLPPNTKRYALVNNGNKQDWNFLGVKTIGFQLVTDHENSYKQLYDTINEWKEYTISGMLDKKVRIEKIIFDGPPDKINDQDFLERVIKDPITVNIFCSNAKGLEWLKWIENIDCFEEIFQPNILLKNNQKKLLYWLIENYFFEYSNKCLSLIQRNKLNINSEFWTAIARGLIVNFNEISPPLVYKWVCVLLNNEQTYNYKGLLEAILIKCTFPDNKRLIILLFTYLIEPKISLEPYMVNTGVYVNMVTKGDAYFLKDAWEDLLKPNLSYFAEKIEPAITNAFLVADLQQRALTDEYYFDGINYSRRSIWDNTEYHNKFDIVINIARDIMKFYIDTNSTKAKRLIKRWNNIGPLILKRIAIYGVIESEFFNLEEKFYWVLKNNYINEYGINIEVNELVNRFYSQAPHNIKRKVIEAMKHVPENLRPGKINEERRKEIILKGLYRLYKLDVKFDYAKISFEKYKKENPEVKLYKQQKTSRSEEEKISADNLLEMNSNEIIKLYLHVKKETEREQIINSIIEAAFKDFNWSLKLVVEIKKGGKPLFELCNSVLKGWDYSNNISYENWEKILLLIHDIVEDEQYIYIIGRDVLSSLIFKYVNQNKEIDVSSLSIAEDIAKKLYKQIYELNLNEKELNSQRYYEYFYNHLGGELGKFWISGLNKRIYFLKGNWSDLPECYHEFFEQILKLESKTDEAAVTIVFSKLHIIFDINAKWTIKKLIPLLDWNLNSDAKKFWSGLLFSGKLNKALAAKLLPSFIKSFKKVPSELSSMKRQFCNRFAYISLFLYNKDNQMIDKFINDADEESHILWLDHIIYIFRKQLGEKQIREIWESWFNEYWKKRIDGIPKPFSNDEKLKLLRLLIYLKSVFGEAVDNICMMSFPEAKHARIYNELLENNYVKEFPVEVIKLVLYLIPITDMNYYCCDNIKDIIKELETINVPTGELEKIIKKASDQGCLYIND